MLKTKLINTQNSPLPNCLYLIILLLSFIIISAAEVICVYSIHVVKNTLKWGAATNIFPTLYPVALHQQPRWEYLPYRNGQMLHIWVHFVFTESRLLNIDQHTTALCFPNST